ncbi:MAG: dTDP-4-dehydrorhamnose reductase [Acinetobacter sp.]|nr:dTDP-4-dehydrorhamnose reductase [Acinetobacter sp.]
MLLVTGANGQLGQALLQSCPDAIYASRKELDITNRDDVMRYVDKHQVKTIINCAAYTAVDNAEADVDRAFLVNSTAVAHLASTGAHLLHVSTDYVFDGKKSHPYNEGDAPCPKSVYGQSKYEGEIAALTLSSAAIVVRTSWVYSMVANNFFKTMQRLGREREEVSVVADQVGTPTYAPDLAQVLIAIAAQIKQGQREIYHYTNEGIASWYDFAFEIMSESGLNCKVKPIASADYPTKAERPFYSVLSKAKIKKDFSLDIPHWKESLKACLTQSS